MVVKAEVGVQLWQCPKSPRNHSEKLKSCIEARRCQGSAWFEAMGRRGEGGARTAAWPMNSLPAGGQLSAFVLLVLPGFLRFIGDGLLMGVAWAFMPSMEGLLG